MLNLKLFLGFCVQTFPFAITCVIPFWDNLRHGKKLTVLFLTLLLLVMGAIFSFTANFYNFFKLYYVDTMDFANIVFLTCIIPCLFAYIFLISDKWEKKLFIFFFAMTSAMGITALYNLVEFVFITPASNELWPYSNQTIINLIFISMLVLPVNIILLKRSTPTMDKMPRANMKQLAMLSGFIFLLLLYALVFVADDKFMDLRVTILYLILVITIYVMYYFSFRILSITYEKYELSQSILTAKNQMIIIKEQYERIHTGIDNARREKHDFRQHIIAIQGYLENIDCKLAKKYIEDYLKLQDEIMLHKFCNHMVVDSLLRHYHGIANGNNINFEAKVNLSENIEIEDMDISVLLGNLLENAIRAASEDKKPNSYVKMAISKVANNLVIVVDNTFEKLSIDCDGDYISTKDEISGIGLESIRRVVEKYHRDAEFTNDDNEFRVSILMKLKE